MELKVIAYARNGHTDKFGIPRQSRDESPIRTRIVFEPEYRMQEALRGIEDFSHLWLLWGFSEVESQKSKAKSDWSPTVRPSRLGGNKRMGVFATRSPFRPNPIGLTSVRLLQVADGELVVSGADLMDGTPIYDIKPYLSYSDCHDDAQDGFADAHRDDRLDVSLLRELAYILEQDPRPGYQDDPEREYRMDYAGYKVTFTVADRKVHIVRIEPTTRLCPVTTND